MKRLVALSALAVLVLSLTPPVSAGGGCHGPFTDEHTTTVGLGMNCFTPTIARINTGDTVRFVNKDGVPHAIGGIGDTFGHNAEISGGEELSFEFQEEGIFPYVCVFHPGMGGAIVVGDGDGGVAAGSGVVPAVSSNDDASEGAPTDDAAATSAASQPTGDRGWMIGAGIAVGLVLLVIAALPRRRSVPQL